MMSAEYTPDSSHVDLNLGDDAVLAYVQDEAEAGIALKEADPIKWFIGTVAVANRKMPSEVGDADLMAKAILDERIIDPTVYREIKNYLGSKGLRWISGCFG